MSESITDLTPAQPALFEQRLLKRLATPATNMVTGAIPRRTHAGPIPLSFAQERIWFLDRLYPGLPTYNEPSAVRLRGTLDVAALQQALTALVARHEVLRTTFQVFDGIPQQVIGPPLEVPLPLVAVDHEVDPLAAAQAKFTALLDAPFDLQCDLMLRAQLFRLSDRDHLLLLVNHHIASDAWSARPRLTEIAEFYTALVEERAPRLKPLPIQYADYALWQRAWLQGDRLARQLAYWRTQLAELEPLTLPGVRRRPAMYSQRGSDIRFVLAPDLAGQLSEFARAQNATIYMALLAVFATLVARYTGQSDIAVGTPTANRRRIEVESMIGYFVNTLVMRVDLAGSPSFRNLLDRVRRIALAAYDHQDLQFEKLVEELRPERRLNQNPLISILFQVHDLFPSEMGLPGLTLTRLDVSDGHAKFDLDCAFLLQPDGIVGRWRYATDLYDEDTIWRMADHFQTLLAAILADPDAPVDQLPLLTAVERQQILVDWNRTAAPLPEDQCLHELFSAQVARTPGAIAFVWGAERLTYGELNARAERLAVHLQQFGAGPDIPVALYLARTPDVIVAMLAALKAGAAYVPLDPAHPPQRTRQILEEGAIPLLVTQDALRASLPPTTARILCVDAEPLAQGAISPSQVAGPDSLAYVIYTSGSTGKPKGVAVEHRAAVNLMTGMQSRLGLTAADVVLAATTFAFDTAGFDVHLPLLAGAQLVLADDCQLRDGHQLQTLIDASGATVMQATPSTWQMLLDAGWQGRPELQVLATGERLTRKLATALQLRSRSLWNLYGPTETTIWSTIHVVQEQEDPVPIGRPLPNTRLYVLTGGGQPAPVGVPGELYIGGAGLARGYFLRPDLTAERFVADPFAAGGAARLYRTGDLVAWRADGALEYLGRNDNQVKVRGHRIELGEIEAALASHPAVQACVVAANRSGDDIRLVAYVVLMSGHLLTSGDLARYLRTLLPGYMIPTAVLQLDALPLTANGKVDRTVLPDPQGLRPDDGVTLVAPRSALEAALAAIWSALLSITPISVHDNFFALGGHSLLATRVLSRIRSQFQVDLPLRTLFEGPTVAEQATAIAALRRGQPLPAPLSAVDKDKQHGFEEFVV